MATPDRTLLTEANLSTPGRLKDIIDSVAVDAATTAVAPAVADAQSAQADAAQSATDAQNALLAPGALPTKFANLITDPTYTVFGTTGWNFIGGTAVRSGTNAVVTGNGTRWDIGLFVTEPQAFVGKAGHRYYVRTVMNVTADSANDATYFSVYLTDGVTRLYVTPTAQAVTSPTRNIRYVVSGTVELPANWDGKKVYLYQAAYFANDAAANGSKVFLYPAYIADLTEASPSIPEPTRAILDREFGQTSTAPVTSHTRSAVTILDRTFATKTRRSVASGPHVVLRFDDGFRNNLSVAAPIMARYGYPGTLYTTTQNPSLSGATANNPLMTADEHRVLADVFGWEIGSHTRLHEDALVTDIAEWRASARGSALDIKAWGLPHPTSFAYPNGSRNAATDRLIYGLFDKCAITTAPQVSPTPYNRGTFFTGWNALGGATDADGRASLARAKRYIAASFERGDVPIVAMHGVTLNQPTLPHFLRADLMADLCQWIWAEGYPVSTQADTPRHNMIADPRFATQDATTTLIGHPWHPSTNNEWRRSTDPNSYAGQCARLDATAGIGPGSTAWLEQRVGVTPGESYKLYLHHFSPAVTAGSVIGEIRFYNLMNNQIGAAMTGATISGGASTGGAGGAWVGGTPFTVPAGATVVAVSVRANPTTGVTGDIRLDCVAMFPTTTYDPLA